MIVLSSLHRISHLTVLCVLWGFFTVRCKEDMIVFFVLKVELKLCDCVVGRMDSTFHRREITDVRDEKCPVWTICYQGLPPEAKNGCCSVKAWGLRWFSWIYRLSFSCFFFSFWRPNNTSGFVNKCIFLPLENQSLYLQSCSASVWSALCSFCRLAPSDLSFLCALLLLTPPSGRSASVPKMLLLSKTNHQPRYLDCMRTVTQVFDVTTSSFFAFLFPVQCSVTLSCTFCLKNRTRSTIILPKGHFFGESHMHFQTFLLDFVYFDENWHIAFIDHDAWWLETFFWKENNVTFFCWSTLPTK